VVLSKPPKTVYNVICVCFHFNNHKKKTFFPHVKQFASFAVFAAAAIIAAMTAGCRAERAVTRGENPVFSPDGRRIAFQRLESDVFKIGVIPAKGGDVEWIESGPGNAAYPVWTPDGALIYMAGNDTETAYEAWKSNSRSGYGLRLFKDGEKRDLTEGRCRDYTPCVSPDGKTVYFVTTRGVESESTSFSQAAATRIATLDLEAVRDGPAPQDHMPRILLDSPNGNNSGYVQPAVSPDGKILAWGHLASFFDSWRICGMRLCEGSEGARPLAAHITPSSLVALSPRWHPNGRLICFTGFHKGDPGWGVWVEDVRTGKVKRIATGENPCFSPDGATIAYNREDTIFVRPFGPKDEPDELLPDARDENTQETVLLSTNNVTSETTLDIANDKRFAFGDASTFFVRAKVRLAGVGGVRQIVTGDYAENHRAFQIYHSAGNIWFSTRGFDGKWLGVKAEGGTRSRASVVAQEPDSEGAGGSPATLAIVAVRTPMRLVLSIDGREPKTIIQGPFLSLDTPLRLITGTGLGQGDVIESLEIGKGWPKELPKAPTREDLFK
jgi:Tol biopolymer transport system component